MNGLQIIVKRDSLDWDDENRLLMIVDNTKSGYYGYDGNGERAYKLTGSTEMDTTANGGRHVQMHFDDMVLYVNPYFVVTPTGYTKHYYNGSQHVATRIGNLSHLPDNIIDTTAIGMERLMNARSYMDTLFAQSFAVQPDTTATFIDIDGDTLPELQWHHVDSNLVWALTVESDSDMVYPILTKDASHLDTRISGTYYFHPDHLGSAHWVTKEDSVIQHIHYMPFGEMWYNQRNSPYNERFKYTGKERDEETGYDFFGARYYASGKPTWLSVDPLSDKYPSISPYAYCNWNPLNRIDPDGKGVFSSSIALRRAGKSVINNPKYLKTETTTFCNVGAQAINSLSGDQSLQGNANTMGAYLRNPKNATSLSQEEALEYANMGAIVFASYVSDEKGHGHIAVVAPTESLSYSQSRKENVVSVFNIGSDNGEMPLGYAFGKRIVGLYILNKDLNTIKDRMFSIDGGLLREIVVIEKNPIELKPDVITIDVKKQNVNINL